VVGGGEVERLGVTPGVDEFGVLVGVAVGQFVARQVRHVEQELRQLRVQSPAILGQLLDVLPRHACVRPQGRGVHTAPGRGADLLGGPVGVGAGIVQRADRGHMPVEQVRQPREVEPESAPREPAHRVGRRVEQHSRVVHGDSRSRDVGQQPARGSRQA
jgi:hypothetical protein